MRMEKYEICTKQHTPGRQALVCFRIGNYISLSEYSLNPCVNFISFLLMECA